MAGRIYSTRFPMTPDDGANSHYSVPDGFVAVVRDMRFYLPSHGYWPAGPVCQVNIDGPGNIIWEIPGTNVAGGVYSWHGRQVFQLVLSWVHQATAPPAALTASGYLLQVPAP